MEDISIYVTEEEALTKLSAVPAGCDDNMQPFYKINGVPYVVVDGVLHTVSDWGGYNEADYPVRKTAFKELTK